MFQRTHHQRIATVLQQLNGPLLLANQCLFGGGTAIALRCGEYRESVDMDFLVADMGCYRNLRQLLTQPEGIRHILLPSAMNIAQAREIRADQYGLRTVLQVADQPIKFEIVLEGRIALDAPTPADQICGIATLTMLDLACSKLLANADRWADDGVFSRDLIDLGMMQPRLPLLRKAVTKTEAAYGNTITRDLGKAIEKMQQRHGWLEKCMQAMNMTLPPALVWQRIRALRRVL